jgi:hypothetical protein
MGDARDIKSCPKCKMAFAGNIDRCPSCKTFVPDATPPADLNDILTGGLA